MDPCFIIAPSTYSPKANASNYVTFAAPKNYKDPAKIVEYVAQAKAGFTQDLQDPFCRQPHLMDITYTVLAFDFDGTSSQNLGAFSTRDIPEVIEEHVTDTFDEGCSQALIVATNADYVVRNIRREAMMAGKEIGSLFLKPIDPLHALIQSSAFSNLNEVGREELLGYSDELTFLSSFCTSFWGQLHRL